MLKTAKGQRAPYFEVRRSAIQGRGVFARIDIPAKTRIIEYLGERISTKEADRRSNDERAGRHHTFLFSVSPRRVIDASRGGNEARYINHKCVPNCEAVNEGTRIFIESRRRILAGEELAYDYSYVTDASYTDEDLKRIYPCRCGTSRCRGTLAALREKPTRAKAAPKKASSKTSRRKLATKPKNAKTSKSGRRSGVGAGSNGATKRSKSSSKRPVARRGSKAST